MVISDVFDSFFAWFKSIVIVGSPTHLSEPLSESFLNEVPNFRILK